MSTTDAEEYTRAEATLTGPDGRPTETYRAYLEHQQVYEEAHRRRREAYAAARRSAVALQNWPTTGAAFARDVDAAYDGWLAAGHKNEVEAALAVLAAHETAEKKTTEKE